MSDSKTPVVGIVMGSESDLPIMQETQAILDKLGIAYETRVISAHRTPARAHDFASNAEARGIKVIIAAAGKAAHLAGVIAAYTPLPIIGVPITTSDLGGLDSLLSMVQMPGGIPVATVAIGKAGAKNAGILAAQMLSLADPAVREKLVAYREAMAKSVAEADARVSGIDA
jgi:phosphoribosylaminoimidazole carboxylase PurE protein